MMCECVGYDVMCVWCEVEMLGVREGWIVMWMWV